MRWYEAESGEISEKGLTYIALEAKLPVARVSAPHWRHSDYLSIRLADLSERLTSMEFEALFGLLLDRLVHGN